MLELRWHGVFGLIDHHGGCGGGIIFLIVQERGLRDHSIARDLGLHIRGQQAHTERSLLLLSSRAVARSFWRRAALFFGVFILGGIGRPTTEEKQKRKERRPFSKEDEKQTCSKEDVEQGLVADFLATGLQV